MPDVTMPQLGETVTEGTITRWFKAVGETIAEDEPLFEVSTDKVDSEVPSPYSGVLSEIRVQEGDTVDVGVTLAVIGDSAAAPPATPEAPAVPAAEAPIEPDPSGSGAEAKSEQAVQAPATGDAPAVAAADEPEVTAPAAGGGDELSSTWTADGQPTAAPLDSNAQKEPADQAAGGDRPTGSGSDRLLSPVVRRLLSENELDPSTIEGTGAGGRITRADVLAVIEGRGAGQTAPAAQAPAAAGTSDQPDAAAVASEETKRLARDDAPAAAGAPLQPDQGDADRERREAEARGKAPDRVAAAVPTAPAPARTPASRPATANGGERDEVVAFSNIRRRTAEHMVRSKATSAHTLIVIEVDYDNVDRVRLANRDRFRAEEGVSLTYLPFQSRAVVDAVRDFPHVNASVGDDELIVHHDLHLGIAVDLDFNGLVAPVVHGADGLNLRGLARSIADLASRARSRKLGPDDIAGGTFTISNAGPYGTLVTGAIINQPQVAILATDGIKKRPVVVELPDGTDAIAIHPVGNLAVTFDHRAFDGAYAAAFLARLKEILETRDWAGELG